LESLGNLSEKREKDGAEVQKRRRDDGAKLDDHSCYGDFFVAWGIFAYLVIGEKGPIRGISAWLKIFQGNLLIRPICRTRYRALIL